jgi:2'-5' RNA ligase
MAGEGIDWPRLLQSAEVKRASSTVDRVTLYRSVLSQHGPNYTDLMSAPLIAPPA